MKYATTKEFAELVGITERAVQKAIQTGRIDVCLYKNKRMIEVESQLKKFKQNTNPAKQRKKKDNNKIEKHIGSTKVTEPFSDEIENTDDATYDNIPQIDFEEMPPEGTVANAQFKKLYFDGLRSRQNLMKETGQLLYTDDAISLYSSVLSELANTIQSLPTRCVGQIVAEIKKSVKSWKSNNSEQLLQSVVQNILNNQMRSVLESVILKEQNAKTVAEEFVENDRKKKH